MQPFYTSVLPAPPHQESFAPNRPKWSRGRVVGMYALHVYPVAAVVLLLVVPPSPSRHGRCPIPSVPLPGVQADNVGSPRFGGGGAEAGVDVETVGSERVDAPA